MIASISRILKAAFLIARSIAAPFARVCHRNESTPVVDAEANHHPEH
eukprot:CAMPEP_0195568706 /NCGR_PEP_ID=MMETSP0814-20130614/2401_1 /TAXON_ID=97485 /ORGANISM="Prymnesium parvum, Strain Texoma1" /LENGTH=46 /DNA_ID= /DNA_START= /DNA_END= /DNA_ORIENTATION=